MMNKFKCTCYPMNEEYVTTVEADDREEAKVIAEKEAHQNCCFVVMDEDVEEL